MMDQQAEKQLNVFLDSDALSDEFFIEIVEKKLNISRDKFKLRLVMLTPATGKNENFVSVVLRAKIKIEFTETSLRQSVNFIIKALCTEDKGIKSLDVFQRERVVYEKVLDKLQSIWAEVGVTVQFGPECYKIVQTPFEIITLQDLSCDNFEMVDRKVGLNVEQSKIVLRKLAKFHAASVILHQRENIIDISLDRKISMGGLAKNSTISNGYLQVFQSFLKAIKSIEGCADYFDKISKWNKEKLVTSWMKAAEPMKSGFFVLNHGDPWANNMLVSSDDVLFIDYQITFWGSPAADLLYFLVTSVKDEFKVKYFDELVSCYHHELTESLRKMKFNSNVPSLEELHADMLEKGSFVCTRLMFLLVIVKNESASSFDLNSLFAASDENSNMLKTLYQCELYKRALTSWLPFLDKRGFLDSML